MQITAKQLTLVKTHPIDSNSANLPKDFNFFELKASEALDYNWIRPATNNHWLFELKTPVQGRFNWHVFKPHVILDEKTIADSSPVVRKDQVEAILGRRISSTQFQRLDYSLKRFEINTIPRVQHFLSQIAHESGGLRWIVELASGAAYEFRRDLGNVFPGDGPKFKGVDPLQMTGRANYQAFANWIGDQKVMEGWRYVSQAYLFLPSGFWWQNNKMNQLIDNGATVRQVTRRVNGGFNGLSDRERYYRKALDVI